MTGKQLFAQSLGHDVLAADGDVVCTLVCNEAAPQRNTADQATMKRGCEDMVLSREACYQGKRGH